MPEDNTDELNKDKSSEGDSNGLSQNNSNSENKENVKQEEGFNEDSVKINNPEKSKEEKLRELGNDFENDNSSSFNGVYGDKPSGISMFSVFVIIFLVVAVGASFSLFFLWPLMTENLGLEEGEDVVINTTGGITIYNQKKEVACVQVEGEENDFGFKIIFNIQEKSLISILDADEAPQEGERVTKCFNLTGYGKPSNVEIFEIEALSINSSIAYSGVLDGVEDNSMIVIPQ